MTMQDDVFGAGGVPEERAQVYFSKMEIDGWLGIFNPRPERYFADDKGHQKLVADGKRPAVCYEVFFAPVTGNGKSFTKVMVKDSKEWKAIFYSLKEFWGMTDDAKVSERIGETFRGKDAWVKRELVETDTYKDRNTGERKAVMGSKIVEVYTVEQDAVNAANEFYGVTLEDDIPGFADENATSGNGATPDNDKQTAMVFLVEFVKMSLVNGKVDREKLGNYIKDNDVISAHFTIDSPETQAEIAKHEPEKDEMPF